MTAAAAQTALDLVPREEWPIQCGRSLTKALGAHPDDDASTASARSNAEPDAADLVFEADPALEEFGPMTGVDAGSPAREDFVDEPADPPDLAHAPAEAGEPPSEISDYIALAAKLYASPAAGAFLERRLALQRKHGAAAATDLSRPLYLIARDAQDRIAATLDRLRGSPNAETLELARGGCIGAGALLLSLHDAIDAAIAAAPPPDAEHGEGRI